VGDCEGIEANVALSARMIDHKIDNLCWSAPKVPLTCKVKIDCTGANCLLPLPDEVINLDDPGYMPTEICWWAHGTPFRTKNEQNNCWKSGLNEDAPICHLRMNDTRNSSLQGISPAGISSLCWTAPKVPLTCKEKVECDVNDCIIPLPDGAENFDDPGFMPTEISWHEYGIPYKVEVEEGLCWIVRKGKGLRCSLPGGPEFRDTSALSKAKDSLASHRSDLSNMKLIALQQPDSKEALNFRGNNSDSLTTQEHGMIEKKDPKAHQIKPRDDVVSFEKMQRVCWYAPKVLNTCTRDPECWDKKGWRWCNFPFPKGNGAGLVQ
jgi:hypothetical protein